MNELNNLYMISHFFICEGIRKVVVATVACRYYFEISLSGYLQKKSELGIKKDMTEDSRRSMKERHPFYN